VVIPPPGNVASCDIRGSAPGSRELALLDPDRRLTEVSAILLTGGSAFGLAAADGVVGWLEDQGIGYETSAALVPIVPAAVIYDLRQGDADTRPGAPQGRAACEAAGSGDIPTGKVGAGAGATVGKWGGIERATPGGLGVAAVTEKGVTVHALSVVNAVGDAIAPDGTSLTGGREASLPGEGDSRLEDGNTVLTLVSARATLTKSQVRWLAARGTDGVTRAIRPAHTLYDGDVTFAVTVAPQQGENEPDLTLLGYLATEAVVAAITNAVVSSRRD
jgi:L-aminopeptidase/D-esterase-like protein